MMKRTISTLFLLISLCLMASIASAQPLGGRGIIAGPGVTAVGPACSDGKCLTDGVATTGTTIFIWEGTTVDTNEVTLIAPSADPVADVNITLPSATGTILTNIVEDTTPQLGGDLDLNTHEIAIKDISFIPVGYMIDGTTAPSAKATLSSTNKVDIREFSGTANQDLMFMWQIPFDFTGTTITARIIGYISAATAPANTEVVAFSLACVSVANSEIMSTGVGTAQTTSLTADATYVQYDRLATAFSSAITPAGTLAAGESLHCTLIRLATTTDTYAQLFGIAGIEIKYGGALTND